MNFFKIKYLQCEINKSLFKTKLQNIRVMENVTDRLAAPQTLTNKDKEKQVYLFKKLIVVNSQRSFIA